MIFFADLLGVSRTLSTLKQLRDRIDTDKIALQEAHRLRKLIVEQFNEQKPKTESFGAWPEWKPLTKTEREIAGYGSDFQLVRSSDLFNSVSVQQAGKGAWVGVPKKAKRTKKRETRKQRAKKTTSSRTVRETVQKAASTSRRGNLANVAQTIEYGSGATAIEVEMTPAMRRFLFGVLFKKAATAGKISGKKKGFIVYKIPARPFLRPAAEEWEQTLEASLEKRLTEATKGL